MPILGGMTADQARKARLERLRTKLRTGEYRPDPEAIAEVIVTGAAARLRASKS